MRSAIAKRYERWATENLPQLRMRGRKAMGLVVARALDRTRVVRAILLVAGIVSATVITPSLVRHYLGEDASRTQEFWISVVVGTVICAVVVLLQDVVVRRRILSVIDESY